MCRSRVQLPPSALPIIMINVKNVISTLTITFLISSISINCSKKKNERKDLFQGKIDTVGVRVINVSNEEAGKKIRISISGITVPDQEVNIQPKVQGRIKKIYVNVGSNVKAGQIIAEIDDTDYQNTYNRIKADLESAKSQLELAKANYQRAQNLIKNNSISQAEFDSAKSNFESAEARYKSSSEILEKAKIDLNETKIRAPFDGLITNKFVDVGSFVFPQTPIFVIQSRKTYFLGKVSEQDAIFLKKGMKMSVDFPSIGKIIEGELDSVVPSSDRRSFEVKILLNESVRSNLYGVAKAEIEKKAAILVPYEAVSISKDGEYVFSVSDGVARKIKIKILDTLSDYISIEIPDKITQIISPYTDKLYDGIKVKIIYE